MARPTFILAEPEPQEALSTRKLVLETAKFNVITAYSAKEAIELLEIYPNADAVIVHDGLPGAAKAAADIRKRAPGKTMIALAERHGTPLKAANHIVSSHEPHALLTLLREKFGDPRSSNGRVKKPS